MYNIDIESMVCDSSDPAKPNLVKQIVFSMTETDSNGDKVSLGSFVAIEPGSNFTPYEQLTKETVISWIPQEVLDNLYAELAKVIQNKNLSNSQKTNLPWSL